MTAPETYSVVIPAFNAESFIGEALESLLGQNLPPATVIVVNDGTARDLVERLAERLPGYLVPRLVRDDGVSLAKVPV